MISPQGLADNLIPNIYIKNITLNSSYKGTVTKQKKAGYGETTETTQKIDPLGDSANLVLSLKINQTDSTQDEINKFFRSHLSEYVQIFIHQFTSPTEYEELLTKKDFADLTTYQGEKLTGGITHMTNFHIIKRIKFNELQTLGDSKEQQGTEKVLDDGTIIKEITVMVDDFKFSQWHTKGDVDFLAYVIVAAVIDPTLSGSETSKEAFGALSSLKNNSILSKITADIVLLNGNLQQEALLFRIAQDTDPSLFSKYGTPGQVWPGAVHQIGAGPYGADGYRFMAGEEHNPHITHPYLDYSIVPITKFVDNRVKEKIEKSTFNTTSAYQKLNSLSTRYKRDTVNLLDYESYKSKAYISDILLSHDSSGHINGYFTVDKLNLIKAKCALPFLFDNIENFSINIGEAGKKAQYYNSILKHATLNKLSIYKNKGILATVDATDFPNPLSANVLVFNESAEQIGFGNDPFASFILTSEPRTNSLESTGHAQIESYSFKQVNKEGITGNVDFSVDVEYKDPTIEYIKDILPFMSKAIEETSIVLEWAAIKKAFDPATLRLKEGSIKLFITQNYPIPIKNEQGVLTNMSNLVELENFKIAFAKSNDNFEDLKTYLLNATNIKTATEESYLTIQKFLIDLKIQVESLLASFGSKPKKDSKDDNPHTNSTITSKPSFSERILGTQAKGSITVNEYGYDFISGMYGTEPDQPLIVKKDDYINRIEKEILPTLFEKPVNKKTIEEPFIFELTPFPAVLVPSSPSFSDIQKAATNSAYGHLSIPANGSATLYNSVKLPGTTAGPVSAEKIFTSILKYNSMVSEEFLFPTPKEISTRNLDALLLRNHGTKVDLGIIEKVETDAVGGEYQAPGIGSTDGTLSENPLEGQNIDQETQIDPGEQYLDYTNKYPSGEMKKLTDKNIFSNSLLNAFLLGKSVNFKKTSLVDVGTKGIYGFSWSSLAEVIQNSPIQAYSIYVGGDDKGPLKDFTRFNAPPQWDLYAPYPVFQNYINPGTLAKFWFNHQNIVKVEFLNGYEETEYTFFVKNETSFLEPSKADSKKTKVRNVKKPLWGILSYELLTDLTKGERLFCRMTRYDSPLINETLVERLNMPLMNNYFIIEG